MRDIGGATTSRKHTAVKIEENYSGPTIHVIDASRAVGVVSKIMNKDEKADPDILNASRIKRIGRGSGWPEHDVKELIKNYKNSKKKNESIN